MVLAGGLLTASPARADANGPGFEVGLRLGYAFAAGDVGAVSGEANANVGDYVPGQWPLWVDIGYRFTADVYLGGYFQYGFGVVNDDRQDLCRVTNVDCSASDTRFGVMGRYRLPVHAPLIPWVGLGIGYEWGTFSLHQSAVGMSNTDSTWSGFEFANLQAGADYHLAPSVAIGPFVSVSFGQFDHRSVTTVTGMTSTSTDDQVSDKSVHEWILIGARVSFSP